MLHHTTAGLYSTPPPFYTTQRETILMIYSIRRRYFGYRPVSRALNKEVVEELKTVQMCFLNAINKNKIIPSAYLIGYNNHYLYCKVQHYNLSTSYRRKKRTYSRFSIQKTFSNSSSLLFQRGRSTMLILIHQSALKICPVAPSRQCNLY